MVNRFYEPVTWTTEAALKRRGLSVVLSDQSDALLDADSLSLLVSLSRLSEREKERMNLVGDNKLYTTRQLHKLISWVARPVVRSFGRG